MIRKSLLFIVCLSTWLTQIAQNDGVTQIQPEKSELQIQGTVMTEWSSIPQFFISNNSPLNGSTLVAHIKNPQFVSVDPSQIPESWLNEIGNEFEVKTVINTLKKEEYAAAFVSSIRKNQLNGNYEQLTSFEIEWDQSQNRITTPTKRTYASNSVLASGTWYKIRVSQSGVHKITYTDLESYGIDPSSIVPANIRIFGNGGRMLPESNSILRDDDLVENAIVVEDGSDGTFDETDYILFYAEGPIYWDYNPTTQLFNHNVNYYSDYSYYFLTVDQGVGLRISQRASETGVATNVVDRFIDYGYHEINQYNLIKSGKNWLGEIFDGISSNTYNFSFSVPGIISDSQTVATAVVVGRSSTNSSFTLSAAGASETAIITATSGYTNDYAKPGIAELHFNTASTPVSFSITYNPAGNTEAMAWLDYLEFSTWRMLNLSGNQMAFRNTAVTGIGNISEYKINNVTAGVKVWDITDPQRPIEQQGTVTSGQWSSLVANDSLLEFIAFTGSLYYSPIFVEMMVNQNLHSLGATDYIIVSHPNFRSQSEEIGMLHFLKEGISYVVVTPQEIYNEFSSGKQDPSAIRDFVKMFYDRATVPEETPRFLLLFGDASYDYKNRISGNTNMVPTFESINSLAPTASYSSDDFFGLLDDSEGADCFGSLDIGIGRFPVTSGTEATGIVEKIRSYMTESSLFEGQQGCQSGNCPVNNLADWRNMICFIADDGDGNLHFAQANKMANILDTMVNYLNIDKIYLDAYIQTSTPGGERCPEVNEAIDKRVRKGALIINYTGHGGEVGWAHERMLDIPTINAWNNRCNLPVFITATCEFSRFDDPARTSAGEYVLTNPNGGGVSLLTTTRLAFSNYNENLNNSFYEKAFIKTAGIYPTLGELVAYSKTDNGSTLYLRNFALLGDPALTMAYPKNQVVTSTINGVDANLYSDTVNALSQLSITGYIADELGNIINDFNGYLYPTVYDKAITLNTLANDPSVNYVAPFTLQKGILYKGKVSVINGEFSFTFLVPKDIQYAYGEGRISYYAENGISDATGYFESFIIGGSSDSVFSNNTGPVIELYMNDESFLSGGTTDENPVLIAILNDDQGINTVGNGIGHDITAILDGNTGNSVVLNDYYESDLDSYKSGRVSYPFYSLSNGVHTIEFKAWDILNYSSTSSIEFIVAPSSELAIINLINYPNPFTESTQFIFEHNHPCCTLKVQIQIFSITGLLVKTIEMDVQTDGYRAEPIDWNGDNDYGDPLEGGVYVYRLIVQNESGQYGEKSEKLVIIR